MTFEQLIRKIVREEVTTILEEKLSYLLHRKYNDNPPLLTIEQVAELLQISKTRVYELVHNPAFPALRVGRKIRIPTKRLFEWIDNEEKNNI